METSYPTVTHEISRPVDEDTPSITHMTTVAWWIVPIWQMVGINLTHKWLLATCSRQLQLV